MALDTVMDTVDTARGLLMLKLNLDTDMVDTDTADMAILDIEAMDTVDMARGLLMLKQVMDMAMDMAMEVMAMEATEAMVIDMARGLLMLDMAMDTVMDITMDTAMDTAMYTDTVDKKITP